MTLQTLSRDIAALVEAWNPYLLRVSGDREGSGFFWEEEGLVVTAAHFFEKLKAGEALSLVDSAGLAREGALEAWDTRLDLAFVRLKAAAEATGPLPSGFFTGKALAELGTGSLVFPLGRPGKRARIAFGLVQVLSDEPWLSPGGVRLPFYVEVDATINDGFSGGPLVSAEGRLIGMNTLAIPRGSGMTVPVETIRETLAAFRKGTLAKKFYLGVNTVAVKLPAEFAGADSVSGARRERALMVSEIDPGSPADKAGLLAGDILLSASGRPLESYPDLAASLAGLSSEKPAELELEIVRAGKAKNLKALPELR